MSKMLKVTPAEEGLSLDDLIDALVAARDQFGPQAHVIFEADSEKASWTIMSVSADEQWVRLNGEM